MTASTLTAEVVGKRDDLSSKVETSDDELTRQNFGWKIFLHNLNPSSKTPIGMLVEKVAWYVWEDLPKEVRYEQQEADARGDKSPRFVNRTKFDREAAIELIGHYVAFWNSLSLPKNTHEASETARKIVGYTDEQRKYHEGFRQSQAYQDLREFCPHLRFTAPHSITPRAPDLNQWNLDEIPHS
ncbi:hypothetical protein FJZ19_03945 [Candidatus Pacearchaeota archaeon]|nr:hypothetical protein [Candidatus Pacearchaeota archaeon]